MSRTEWVWNDVWRRRVNYFMTVAVSLVLALLPLFHAISPPSACVGPQCVFAPVITTAGEVLPGFVQPWIRAFAISPGFTLLLILVIFLLLGRSAYLKRCINDGMRELWVPPTDCPPSTDAGTRKNGPSNWIYRLRSNIAYQKFFQLLKWRVFPGLFGATVLIGGFLIVAIAVAIGVQRAAIAWSEHTNRYCEIGHFPGTVMSTDAKCWLTGLRVEENKRYRVTLRVTEPWIDRTIPTSPAGFESSRMSWMARPFVLVRRSLSGLWFQPMLKIIPEQGRGQILMLDMRCNCGGQDPVYSAEFDAGRSGSVAMFVNDVMPFFFNDLLPAAGKWSGLRDLYANNKGKAEVTIAEIPRAQPK